MRIYVSHSKGFDYLHELYAPLKESHLPVEFIFPHENSGEAFDTKTLLQNKDCDYVLAEASFPATGQGIELGWADIYEIPIICVYKSGFTPAGSLSVVAKSITEYQDTKDLISKVTVLFGLNIA